MRSLTSALATRTWATTVASRRSAARQERGESSAARTPPGPAPDARPSAPATTGRARSRRRGTTGAGYAGPGPHSTGRWDAPTVPGMDTSTYSFLDVQLADGVALVPFIRPNWAVSEDRELFALTADLQSSAAVRAVI